MLDGICTEGFAVGRLEESRKAASGVSRESTEVEMEMKRIQKFEA